MIELTSPNDWLKLCEPFQHRKPKPTYRSSSTTWNAAQPSSLRDMAALSPGWFRSNRSGRRRSIRPFEKSPNGAVMLPE